MKRRSGRDDDSHLRAVYGAERDDDIGNIFPLASHRVDGVSDDTTRGGDEMNGSLEIGGNGVNDRSAGYGGNSENIEGCLSNGIVMTTVYEQWGSIGDRLA